MNDRVGKQAGERHLRRLDELLAKFDDRPLAYGQCSYIWK
jgi:hypothetical protein